MATLEQWDKVDTLRYRGDSLASCVLELRERLDALEAQQQPAPPTQRELWEVQRGRAPLWEQMHWVGNHGDCDGYAAEIDVVAQWLACKGHHAAADAIRHEASRARGEA